MVSRFSASPQWEAAFKLLTQDQQLRGITIKELWTLLDRAWFECSPPTDAHTNREFLSRYYAHPVWLINGMFSESDPGTVADRLSAVRFIASMKSKTLLDFGGGTGLAARLAAEMLPDLEADIFEVGTPDTGVLQHLSSHPRVRFVGDFNHRYDAIICTEVFEHVIDPVGVAIKLGAALKPGGMFVASWSFAPGIQCHLPQYFHLAKRMFWVLRALGYGFYGFERRASSVFAFIRHSPPTKREIAAARSLEYLSRLRLPFERVLSPFISTP